MSFQENLRTLRLARGLTQPALAEKADIEQSYLSKLENGRSKPSEDVLTRLAGALDTSPEALANGDATESHRFLKPALTGVGVVLLLGAAFFAGRVTAIYPLSAQRITAGSAVLPDLTQKIMRLAPPNIEIIMISHTAKGVSVSGDAKDRSLVMSYLAEIQKQFGGEFVNVMIQPRDSSQAPLHFSFYYSPTGVSPATADDSGRKDAKR